jgi:hypothetical protein
LPSEVHAKVADLHHEVINVLGIVECLGVRQVTTVQRAVPTCKGTHGWHKLVLNDVLLGDDDSNGRIVCDACGHILESGIAYGGEAPRSCQLQDRCPVFDEHDLLIALMFPGRSCKIVTPERREELLTKDGGLIKRTGILRQCILPDTKAFRH